jgi:hypothetical protein
MPDFAEPRVPTDRENALVEVAQILAGGNNWEYRGRLGTAVLCQACALVQAGSPDKRYIGMVESTEKGRGTMGRFPIHHQTAILRVTGNIDIRTWNPELHQSTRGWTGKPCDICGG